MRFSAFFFGLVTATAMSLYYLYRRVTHPPGARLVPRFTGAGLALGAFLALFLSQVAYRSGWVGFGSPAQRWTSLVGFVMMGFLFTTLFVFLLADATTALARVGLRLRRVSGRDRPDPLLPTRRDAIARAVKGGALGMSTLLTTVGWAEAKRGPRVERVTVPLRGLPEAWRGARIVQLTDTHVGPLLGREFTERIVREVNDLSPDIVVLTGDLVDGTPDALAPALAPFAGFRSRHGVFAVTGNHEYYWGADAFIRLLSGFGIQYLLNEHRVLERNGEPLLLAGVTDLQGGRFDPRHESRPDKAISAAESRLLASSGEPTPRLLLAHQPKSCFGAAKAGFDLMISGHTHGGQFFPWNLVVHLAQPYVKGLNRHGEMWVYVSRGTGYWGPPNRLGLPAEISLLELQRA